MGIKKPRKFNIYGKPAYFVRDNGATFYFTLSANEVSP